MKTEPIHPIKFLLWIAFVVNGSLFLGIIQGEQSRSGWVAIILLLLIAMQATPSKDTIVVPVATKEDEAYRTLISAASWIQKGEIDFALQTMLHAHFLLTQGEEEDGTDSIIP